MERQLNKGKNIDYLKQKPNHVKFFKTIKVQNRGLTKHIFFLYSTKYFLKKKHYIANNSPSRINNSQQNHLTQTKHPPIVPLKT